MPHWPATLSALFIATTGATLLLFVLAIPKAQKKVRIRVLGISVLWLALQALLSRSVYSSQLETLPPKIVLFGILPAFLLIAIAFFTKAGRRIIDQLSIPALLLIHVVRIPVETGLDWLCREGAVPKIMTFRGANFDILAGITAPLMLLYFGWKKKAGKPVLLVWNTLATALLLTIVILAALSVPTPLQQFGFEQPNIAILHFPVSWLPTFIVPAVLFSHLALFRRLSQLPASFPSA